MRKKAVVEKNNLFVMKKNTLLLLFLELSPEFLLLLLMQTQVQGVLAGARKADRILEGVENTFNGI